MRVWTIKMAGRPWIKLWPKKWLASIRKARKQSDKYGTHLADFGAFTTLLCIAGDGNYCDIGAIQITPLMGYSDKQIADLMCISRRQWLRYKDKFVITGRISLGQNNQILINSWGNYQPGYKKDILADIRKYLSEYSEVKFVTGKNYRCSNSLRCKEPKVDEQVTELDEKGKKIAAEIGLSTFDEVETSQDHDNDNNLELPDDAFQEQ